MVNLQKAVEKLSIHVGESKTTDVTSNLVSNVPDRSYIANWRELGGNNIIFTPQGRLHPKAFLKKIKKVFEEAGVPTDNRVGLAVSCLKGAAADWAEAKEDTFGNFEEFQRAFIARFWGVDKERDLYLHLCYGKFERGSLSEYFLNLIKQASFLSEEIPEEKLTKMISKHFPSEVQSGLVTRGLYRFEAMEAYLQELDEIYASEQAATSRNTRRYEPPIRRQNSNNDREREGTNRDTIRQITKFNADNEDLYSEMESGDDELSYGTPTIVARVGNQACNILIDSGSEITAISEICYKNIASTINVPLLPVTNTTVAVAVGNKRYRVKQQALVPVEFPDAGSQNVVADTLSRQVPVKDLKIVPEKTNNFKVMVQKPECILSDNGTQYTSKSWKKSLTEMGVQVKYTSLYFPEGNPTERYNREIGRMIRAYCHDKHTRWAYVLDTVEYYLNVAINDSTGMAPVYLQFHKSVPQPIDTYIKYPQSECREEDHQVVIVAARERLLSKAQRRASRLEKSKKLVTFREGDAVLVRRHDQSSAADKVIKKFFLLFDGPFWISKQVGPNSYILKTAEGVELPKQNVVNLRPYQEMPVELE
nr:unnamed protein product [Callosobruchus analis]